MDPTSTKSNSTDSAHFICKNCGYDWTTDIRSQAKGTGKCKCCELQLVIRKGITDVFTLIPESKKFYDFNKNKNIDIYSIPLRDSNIMISWKCPNCENEWDSPLSFRVSGKKAITLSWDAGIVISIFSKINSHQFHLFLNSSNIGTLKKTKQGILIPI